MLVLLAHVARLDTLAADALVQATLLSLVPNDVTSPIMMLLDKKQDHLLQASADEILAPLLDWVRARLTAPLAERVDGADELTADALLARTLDDAGGLHLGNTRDLCVVFVALCRAMNWCVLVVLPGVVARLTLHFAFRPTRIGLRATPHPLDPVC